jgi:hypothetical protein
MSAAYAVLPFPLPLDDPKKIESLRVETAAIVRRLNRSIAAYLSWRTKKFLQENPNLRMPKRVVLSIRIEPIPAPGQATLPLTPEQKTLPLALWRPGEDELDSLPVEPWSFDANRALFEKLMRSEEK